MSKRGAVFFLVCAVYLGLAIFLRFAGGEPYGGWLWWWTGTGVLLLGTFLWAYGPTLDRWLQRKNRSLYDRREQQERIAKDGRDAVYGNPARRKRRNRKAGKR